MSTKSTKRSWNRRGRRRRKKNDFSVEIDSTIPSEYGSVYLKKSLSRTFSDDSDSDINMKVIPDLDLRLTSQQRSQTSTDLQNKFESFSYLQKHKVKSIQESLCPVNIWTDNLFESNKSDLFSLRNINNRVCELEYPCSDKQDDFSSAATLSLNTEPVNIWRDDLFNGSKWSIEKSSDSQDRVNIWNDSLLNQIDSTKFEIESSYSESQPINLWCDALEEQVVGVSSTQTGNAELVRQQSTSFGEHNLNETEITDKLTIAVKKRSDPDHHQDRESNIHQSSIGVMTTDPGCLPDANIISMEVAVTRHDTVHHSSKENSCRQSSISNSSGCKAAPVKEKLNQAQYKTCQNDEITLIYIPQKAPQNGDYLDPAFDRRDSGMPLKFRPGVAEQHDNLDFFFRCYYKHSKTYTKYVPLSISNVYQLKQYGELKRDWFWKNHPVKHVILSGLCVDVRYYGSTSTLVVLELDDFSGDTIECCIPQTKLSLQTIVRAFEIPELIHVGGLISQYRDTRQINVLYLRQINQTNELEFWRAALKWRKLLSIPWVLDQKYISDWETLNASQKSLS
ncbi:telomere regulation protein Stn1-domain-containing protein [Lipomyces oligophaga]|uniref:telomere regulation protein Stn1-domain-containing protein n=1 Tax=Lipomyces oligophaga TaxID=45792 RepID=UPI0034CEB9B7